MRTRAIGAILVAAGAGLMVAAVLPWFSAAPLGRRETISGVAASGELWALPVLGLVLAGVGLGVWRGRPAPRSPGARWAAALAASAGLAALAFVARHAAEPPVHVTIVGSAPAEDVPAAVSLEPGVHLAGAAGGLAALAALTLVLPEVAALLAAWRRARRASRLAR